MHVAHIPPAYRGRGTTTQQMRDAPIGSIYVWPVAALCYPRDLARHLGRLDLRIMGPAAFYDGGRRLAGWEVPAIIIDHACALSAEDWDAYRWLLARACQPSTANGGE